MIRPSHKLLLAGAGLAAVTLLTGCTRDGKFQAISMWNESRLKPLEEMPAQPGVSSSRALPDGVIARGDYAANDPINTGRTGKTLASRIPFPITKEVLQRGQDRFNIYCSPCHSKVGDGNGMIVRRGFPHPPDYAIKRLRDAPVGHFFDVATNGYGVMYSYASRVPVNDRWAIASYIRTLQAARPEVPDEKFKQERENARLKGPSRPTGPETEPLPTNRATGPGGKTAPQSGEANPRPGGALPTNGPEGPGNAPLERRPTGTAPTANGPAPSGR